MRDQIEAAVADMEYIEACLTNLVTDYREAALRYLDEHPEPGCSYPPPSTPKSRDPATYTNSYRRGTGYHSRCWTCVPGTPLNYEAPALMR